MKITRDIHAIDYKDRDFTIRLTVESITENVHSGHGNRPELLTDAVSAAVEPLQLALRKIRDAHVDS